MRWRKWVAWQWSNRLLAWSSPTSSKCTPGQGVQVKRLHNLVIDWFIWVDWWIYVRNFQSSAFLSFVKTYLCFFLVPNLACIWLIWHHQERNASQKNQRILWRSWWLRDKFHLYIEKYFNYIWIFSRSILKSTEHLINFEIQFAINQPDLNRINYSTIFIILEMKRDANHFGGIQKKWVHLDIYIQIVWLKRLTTKKTFWKYITFLHQYIVFFRI